MFWVLSLFFNVPVLIALLVLAAAAAGIYFTLGPAKLVQIALDARTWLVVGGVFVYLTLQDTAKTIEAQQQKIETAKIAETAGNDSQAVVTGVMEKQEEREVAEQELQAAIDKAAPGDEVDALMDEIARQQDAADAARRD